MTVAPISSNPVVEDYWSVETISPPKLLIIAVIVDLPSLLDSLTVPQSLPFIIVYQWEPHIPGISVSFIVPRSIDPHLVQ